MDNTTLGSTYECKLCGEVVEIGKMHLCAKPPKAEKHFMSYGWICPLCGRGVAPFATECSHGGTSYIVTCTATEVKT